MPPAAVLEKVAQTVEAPLRPRRKRRAKQWFEEIFDDDYLRTLPFLTPRQTEREAPFVAESLGIPTGGALLDLACGYGRHAMELAAKSYKVTGLDLSLPLLIRAADAARRVGVNVNFIHGDMREMTFEDEFDGAYCMFTSFGYFDDDTNRKVAANLARAIKPGGRLLIDVVNRDYLVRDLPTRVWWQGDGCVVLEEVDFNYFSSPRAGAAVDHLRGRPPGGAGDLHPRLLAARDRQGPPPRRLPRDGGLRRLVACAASFSAPSRVS